MRDHDAAVRAFFEDYAARMNDALADPPRVDVAAARRAFADHFVGTDPKSVRGGRNGLLLRLMIPRGYAHYRKIGAKRMEVRGLEITPLDDFHVMAKAHWWSVYERRRGGERIEIEFDNIYLLHIPEDGSPRIFAWITGDEQQVLKEHGLTG